ncbi:MAG: exopolygalacturonase [Acidobacteria bacterium]|nr:exopolygalacturonase [Acidobacteriota bacterium]
MRLFISLSLSLSVLLAAGWNAETHAVKSKTASAKGTSVVDFGAVGDGRTLNTERIQSAINQLASKGGGTLVFPRGVFMSGAIFLKPGVNLQLDEGAVLKGSADRKDYPKMRTRVEGHFEEWLPALVNADGVNHLRIGGSGTLDGNGAPFWADFWARRKENPKTTNLDVERPRLALIQNSQDVRISGVTFKDSGFWNLHLYRCKNVVVENVRFEVPADARAPSTDGTDIDSCQNVTIRGCTYRVDDDAVCIKGSKGPFARDDKDSPPVEHIRVTGCTFERGHGVVTLGSEATVVRDVVVEKSRVVGPAALVRLKLRPDTPQLYEDIHYRDITLDSPAGSLVEVRPWRQFFDLQGQPPPKSVVRNVTLSNVRGSYGSFGELQGNPGQTEISDITLENIDVRLKNEKLNAVDVKNLKVEHVTVNGKPFSLTPAASPPKPE